MCPIYHRELGAQKKFGSENKFLLRLMRRGSRLEALKAEWGENEKSFAGIISHFLSPGFGRGLGRAGEKLKPCVWPSVTRESGDKSWQKGPWQKRNLQRRPIQHRPVGKHEP